MRCLLALLLCCCAVAASAAVNSVADAKSVLAGNDYNAKKQAVAALATIGDDAEAMPVLIAALGDRQASRFAVDAIRKRTGISPASAKSANTGYPGYPPQDTVAAWSAWWAAKQADQQKKKDLEEAKKAAEEAQKQAKEALEGPKDAPAAGGAEGEATADAGGEAAADGDTAAAGGVGADDVDYGKVDRIFFTDGGILLAFIVTKRQDLDGKLTSIRVMHRDGGGEETLDAALIARIEEDVR